MSLWVKVCGIRSAAEVEACLAAGVDAIGLNFVPTSKRFIPPEGAAALVRQFGKQAQWVAVVADRSATELRALREAVGFDLWQLHGGEPPELLAALGADAYKAVGVATAADVEAARRFGGERLLVDAKVAGALGGTGRSFDWRLVRELAKERSLIVAGGLTPSNVGVAVEQLSPFGVDTASGVEGADGLKDAARVKAFLTAARAPAA